MKYFIMAVLLSLTISACGGAKATSAAHDAASSPQAQADAKRAQAIVTKCAQKSNLFSKKGRQAFYTCVAPAGKKAQVEKCIQAASAKTGVLSKRARHKLLSEEIPKCVLA